MKKADISIDMVIVLLILLIFVVVAMFLIIKTGGRFNRIIGFLG